MMILGPNGHVEELAAALRISPARVLRCDVMRGELWFRTIEDEPHPRAVVTLDREDSETLSDFRARAWKRAAELAKEKR